MSAWTGMGSGSARARRAGWHVSASVDLSGYAFSWVFVAVPAFLFLGGDPTHSLLVYASATLIVDLHRHYTLPYVYLDREIRRSYPVRFFALPALCLLLWTQTPELAHSNRTAGTPEAGAMLVWLWLTIQLVRQDRGGRFQGRVALPMFVGGAALGGAIHWLAGSARVASWSWIAIGVAVSLALHLQVGRDAPGDPTAGKRTHWVFPVGAAAVAAGAFLAWGELRVPVRAPTGALLATFLLWQTYHVLMQKYGILRIYSAKSGQPDKVPAWVDRTLIMSIVPVFLVWAGSSQLDTIRFEMTRVNPNVADVLIPPLTFLGDHVATLMTLAGAFGLAAIAAFAWHEWKLHRLQNAPRLWFALGTLMLYATLFPLGVMNAYMVFACAHGIEYMVFVCAFQQRRYAQQGRGGPDRSPLLRHPVIFYLAFSTLIVGAVLYARYGAQVTGLSTPIFGESARDWLFWYTLYQGLLHFYYDGFLWKVRRPAMRAQL